MQKSVTNFTEEHKEQNQNKSIQSFKVHKLKNASFRLDPVTLKECLAWLHLFFWNLDMY